MKVKVLRFFEYEKVKFSNTYQLAETGRPINFTPPQISAFRKLHTDTNGLYYDLIDNGIKFKEQVGVIQINDLTIEVLPKIDKEDNETSRWHDILLDMLKECRFLEPNSSEYANLKLRSNSLLQLYFEKYISQLEDLLHRGLIRKYRKEEDNQQTLKGKLLFNKHIQHNLIHAERFYTNHTVYDKNHNIHQILLQALQVIQHLSEESELLDRINTLITVWPNSTQLHINQTLFDSIPINRKTQFYQESLLIARMILLNYHPDLRGGDQSVLALMFNMNDLWEEFIFRRLKKAERQLDWKVSSQKGMSYWTGESGAKKLIPDIIIQCKSTGRKIIFDTKWKRPVRNKPDDQDLRQLLSYKLYYQGDMAYLVYPCCSGRSFIMDGQYHNQVHQGNIEVFKDGFGLQGGLMFIDIINERKLVSKKEFVEVIILPIIRSAV